MEPTAGPSPETIYPIKDYDKLGFLKNFIKASNIYVGDYTYFDDRRYGPEKFEEYNVLYNYDFSKVKLVIGKFCAIAAETRFIMTGDHKLDAISTYPFPIFGHGWESVFNVGPGVLLVNSQPNEDQRRDDAPDDLNYWHTVRVEGFAVFSVTIKNNKIK